MRPTAPPALTPRRSPLLRQAAQGGEVEDLDQFAAAAHADHVRALEPVERTAERLGHRAEARGELALAGRQPDHAGGRPRRRATQRRAQLLVGELPKIARKARRHRQQQLLHAPVEHEHEMGHGAEQAHGERRTLEQQGAELAACRSGGAGSRPWSRCSRDRSRERAPTRRRSRPAPRAGSSPCARRGRA